MPDVIRAPWTPGQVEALNAWQAGSGTHPFTCGCGACHPATSPVLHATPDGWRCPDTDCHYVQDWAHAAMAQPQPADDFAQRAAEMLAQAMKHPGAAEHLAVYQAAAGLVPVPRAAFGMLVQVAAHVSAGRSFAFLPGRPYPDATARRALGALDDAGLLPADLGDALRADAPLTSCECGRIPDPGVCQASHSSGLTAGGHCRCAHEALG